MCQSRAQGGRRCAAHQAHAAATSLIPRRGALRGYYAATDTKHFNRSTAGSTFTDPALRRLNDVVALAHRQRGNLHGDDRDELAALGTPENAFKPGIRYLLVRTPGTVGIEWSEGLTNDTPIRIERTKPGAPCSLVHVVTTTPTTEVGTIIIGRQQDDGPEVVFTAHPGLPVPTDLTDRLAEFAGTTITLGEVRDAYGGEVWLNTRVRV